MTSRLKTLLTFGGSLALGAGLLYLALRGVDFSVVGEALQTASYGWIVPLLVVTLLSHALRAWRWRSLLDVLPEEPLPSTKPSATTLQAFYATMVGYMVNQAAPRLGEPARAANLAAVTRHSFPAAFGTVVVERILDVMTLGIALVSVFVLFRSQLGSLLAEFSGGIGALGSGLESNAMVLLLVGLLALAACAGALWWWRRAQQTGRPSKFRTLIASFGDGLRSLLRVRSPLGLLVSTAAIWFCYAVMTYIPLEMLGLADAYGLSLLDAWAMVSLGAVGMALPAPGGTGSYHYAIITTMTLLLGVPETPAATYAILTHGVQLIFLVVVGFACLLAQGAGFGALQAAPPSEGPHASDLALPVTPTE